MQKAAVLGIFLLLGVVILTALDTASLSGGIDRELDRQQGGSLEKGCSCHTEIAFPDVRAVLEGVPSNFTRPEDGTAIQAAGDYAPRPFPLNISIEGGPEPGDAAQGGFNLWVSGGRLEPLDDTAQVLETTPDANEITHTRAGNGQRNWSVQWTPPEEPDDSVVFVLLVNAVNGNGAPEMGDHWARTTLVSMGLSGKIAGAAEEEALEVHKLGVNWLAYWVGLISFVALGVVLVVYYFVLKYSETTRATDHRSRKDRK